MTSRKDERTATWDWQTRTTNPTRPLPARFNQEAGEHATPAAGGRPCEVCGEPMPVRRVGRPRRFCDATCRKRSQRMKLF